jgi:hypothetical protein
VTAIIDCETAREAAPELALDVLDGKERARVLAHVESCPSCRGHLRDLAGTVDALLGLAPPAPAPAPVVVRPRRAHRVAALVAVAGALVALLGVALNATAHRGPERAALVSPSGQRIGYAIAGRGTVDTWVERPVAATEVGCRVRFADGRTALLGPFPLGGGMGWWRSRLPGGGEVRTLELVDGGGNVVAIARFA